MSQASFSGLQTLACSIFKPILQSSDYNEAGSQWGKEELTKAEKRVHGHRRKIEDF